MSERLQRLIDYLAESPQDPFIKYAIAAEHVKLNNTDEALRHFEALRAEHPGYVGTYYHLGKLYESLDRKEEAIMTYEQGIVIARTARDMHALSELQAVYQSVTGFYGDDEDDS